MTPPGAARPRLRAALVPALVATLLVAALRALLPEGPGAGLERRLLDLRFALRGGWPAAERAAVVAVDEAALARREGPEALRAALARALPEILAQAPAAVAIDLLFIAETPADRDLARGLAGDPRIVLAAAALDRAAPQAGPPRPPSPAQAAALARSALPVAVRRAGRAPPAPAAWLLPAPELAAAAARLGHVNLARDPDGAARAAPPALPAPGGAPLPALSLAAAARALDAEPRLAGAALRLGPHLLPLDPGGRLVIDFPGPGAVPVHPLDRVLSGALPPGALTGRIVVIGATAPSLRDVFATPFAAARPGAELLAGLAAGLAQGRVIRRDAAAFALSAALALALCAGAAQAARPRPGAAALAALALAWGAGLAAAQAAFAAAGLQLDGPTLLFGLAAGSAAALALRRAAGRRLLAALAREGANLRRFVAPGLAERMAAGGPRAFARRVQPAGLLFADMAGFTTLAESAPPGAAADLLAALHARFEAEAAAHGGVVVDYQGDGALIVFGLPEPRAGDAARALACAQALAAAAPELAPHALGGAVPRLRAGLHFGPVAAGGLGGARQSVVTVAGDAVNLTARLQDAAKAAGADLVATRAALDAAGLDPSAPRSGWRALPAARLRGRRKAEEVWARA
jgi:adenylate cyclase